MSIWASIPGTFALHYEDSVTDPRKAKRLPGVMPGEFGDEIDLAVVVNDVYEDAPNEEGYLPYLRVGITVNNSAEGDVILNRKQVKKLRNELNRFLKDTKKKKEIPVFEDKPSMCDFIWDKDGNHACTLEANHEGMHTCCCKVEFANFKGGPESCKNCNENVIVCGMRENGDCCNHCDHG